MRWWPQRTWLAWLRCAAFVLVASILAALLWLDRRGLPEPLLAKVRTRANAAGLDFTCAACRISPKGLIRITDLELRLLDEPRALLRCPDTEIEIDLISLMRREIPDIELRCSSASLALPLDAAPGAAPLLLDIGALELRRNASELRLRGSCRLRSLHQDLDLIIALGNTVPDGPAGGPPMAALALDWRQQLPQGLAAALAPGGALDRWLPDGAHSSLSGRITPAAWADSQLKAVLRTPVLHPPAVELLPPEYRQLHAQILWSSGTCHVERFSALGPDGATFHAQCRYEPLAAQLSGQIRIALPSATMLDHAHPLFRDRPWTITAPPASQTELTLDLLPSPLHDPARWNLNSSFKTGPLSATHPELPQALALDSIQIQTTSQADRHRLELALVRGPWHLQAHGQIVHLPLAEVLKPRPPALSNEDWKSRVIPLLRQIQEGLVLDRALQGQASFFVDAADPEATRLNALVQAPALHWREASLSNGYLEINATARQVQLSRLQLDGLDGQHLRGHLSLETSTGIVDGALTARLIPSSPMGLPLPQLKTALHPVDMEINLHPSPWNNPALWRAEATAHAARLTLPFHITDLQTLVVNSPRLTAHLSQDNLHLELSADTFFCQALWNAQIHGASRLPEWLRTQADAKAQKEELGELSFTLPPLALELLDALPDDDRLQLQLHTRIDTANPARDEARLLLDSPPMLLRGLSLRKGHAEITLTRNAFTLNRLEIAAEEDELFSASGSLNLLSRRIQGRLQGRIFPERLLRAALPELIAPLDFIAWTGSPPEIELSLLDSPLDELSRWHLKGSLRAHDFSINSLPFDALETQLEYANATLRTWDSKAYGPRISGQFSLAYDFNHDHLVMDGSSVGDPRHIAHFIFDEEARAGYLSIWEAYTWDPSAPPRFKGHFELLPNNQHQPGQPDWRIVLRGHGTVAGGSMNGVKTQLFAGDINLDYPDYFAITDASVTLSEGSITGALGLYDLAGDTQLDYEFLSSISPVSLLRAINPQWLDSTLKDIHFPATAAVRSAGTVPLMRPALAKLQAQAALQSLGFSSFQASDLLLRIRCGEGKLQLHADHAPFHQGLLDFSLESDLAAIDTPTHLQIKGTQMDLASLLADAGASANLRSAAGKVGFTADLALTTKAGQGLAAVSGPGELLISEASFWEIPLLTPFLNTVESYVPFTQSTRIRQLKAQLLFEEQRILVQQFQTDGAILSLSGDGFYSWADGVYSFNLVSHYLRKVLALPAPFDYDLLAPISAPVSQLLRGRVDGDRENFHWAITAGDNLSDFFFGWLKPQHKLTPNPAPQLQSPGT